MINRIIRYFKGYLRIRISGNTVERFINTCSHKGICLWNLVSSYSQYEMNITISDFKKLKPVIRKTRTKVVIVNRSGFPFFMKKYRRRKLFFTGFFICILMIYLFSTYIWNIRLTGNLTYTNETLIEFLESMDVEKGMKRNDVDCTQIAREIRRKFDDIIWVSASIEGSNLVVQVKENENSKEIAKKADEKKQSAYDLKASRNCQITKIVIRNGIVNIKEGDYVKKGDLLVSGQIPVFNDAKEIINYQYCVSDADIYGKVKLSYEDEISRTHYEKVFAGIQKHEYFLGLGKYRLSLGGIKNDYDHFTEYSRQKSFHIFTAGIRSVYPYTAVSNLYSDEKIRILLSRNFQYYCKELEKKGVVILQNDVKIYTWSDKAKATGYLTVEMPVGQLEKSEIIEIGENIDGNDGNNN